MQRTTFADVIESQKAAFAAGTLVQTKPKKSKTKDLVAQMEVLQLDDAASASASASAASAAPVASSIEEAKETEETEETKEKMLRVFKGDIHYTAILLKNSTVLEVKGRKGCETYESVDEWVASIPATREEIQVSDKEKKPKEPKEKKEKKRKHEEKKCMLPSRTKFLSARWMRHVYEMMVESGLVITEEIVDAFNDLVEYLISQNDKFTTGTPPKFARYNHGIKVEKQQYNIRGIYMDYTPIVDLAERAQIATKIADLYSVLFYLIKGTVVPFMDKKNMYLSAKKECEKEKMLLIKQHDMMERSLQEHEHRIKTYRLMLERTQKNIEMHEATMRRCGDE
jgi:hypothetical protein